MREYITNGCDLHNCPIEMENVLHFAINKTVLMMDKAGLCTIHISAKSLWIAIYIYVKLYQQVYKQMPSENGQRNVALKVYSNQMILDFI